MFLSSGRAEYIDVLERTMYNGLISGVSLSGNMFFYTNPLESQGGYERSPWFEVSCCPGNIVRFLPSVPGYIYAKQGNRFYVNLYAQSEVETVVDGKTFRLKQLTEYPWNGKVEISVFPGKERNLKIMLRIPGWMYNNPVPSDLYYYDDPGDADWSIKINGEQYKGLIINGYVAVEREWKNGDIISLNLPMNIHRVKANENVKSDSGRVALQRGPVVWCMEGIDNPQGVFNTVIPGSVDFKYITGNGTPHKEGIIEGKVKDTDGNDVILKAVPYAFWANRGGGEMAVWMKTI